MPVLALIVSMDSRIKGDQIEGDQNSKYSVKCICVAD
jgi:hypothetical protein